MKMSRPSESARERETFKYMPDAAKDRRRHDLSQPIPSDALRKCRDVALTAFAQLATFKLNASRALISVFDRDFQYIVAEATHSSSLDFSAEHSDDLWLCGMALPRAECICDHVLQMTQSQDASNEKPGACSPLPVSVIPDLTQDARFQSRACMSWNTNHRFYAGVPIRSPRGIDIGVLCIFDDKARAGLVGESVNFMRDLSRVIMGHLEAKRFGDAARRNIRMVRGIGSFVEGHGSMSGWVDSNASAFSATGAEGDLNPRQQLLQRNTGRGAIITPSRPTAPQNQSDADEVVHSEHSTSMVSDQVITPTEQVPAGSDPTSNPTKDHFLPQIKQVFSRAANIIRESIEVEGVLFLDASAWSFGSLKPVSRNKRANLAARVSSNSPSSGSEDERVKSLDPPEGMCTVLGFSTSASSSLDNESPNSYQVNVPERLLKTLLRRYRSGKIFNFEQDGSLVLGESDSSGEEESSTRGVAKSLTKVSMELETEGNTKRRRRNSQYSRENEGRSIIHIIPGARSVAIIPLWDSHKERWFASGIVWTQQPGRTFTTSGEMSYLRVFGTSIMAEVSRINTLISDRAKTDVLESLSHELRSPLHGLVAGAELLHDTQLDAFQKDVLHTVECCGRTLLDVIDHLLDYAKINRFRESPKKPESVALSRREFFEGSILSKFVNVDLAAITEESIESVYAGHSFQKMSAGRFGKQSRPGLSDSNALRHLDTINSMESIGDQIRDPHTEANNVSVYLAMDANANWRYRTQPGALRRIIMNLFGNSLKYTKKGFVHINLRLEPRSSHTSTLHLTITDSGIGIGDEFLRHKLFTPFSQEDRLTQGTGLGLSVVYKIVRMLRGTISVESQVNVGTSVKVSLPMYASKETNGGDEEFAKHVSALSGLRVDISDMNADLHNMNKVNPRMHVENMSDRALVESMCRDWLHMEVVGPGKSDIKADMIICSEAAFDKTTPKITGDDDLPATVVVCWNAISAHEHASLLKPNPLIRVPDFISLPTGPRKMARALTAALDRHIEFKRSLIVPFAVDSVASSSSSVISGACRALRHPEAEKPRFTPNNGSQNIPGGESTNQDQSMLLTPDSGNDFLSASDTGEEEVDMRTIVNVERKYLLVDDNEINLKILAALIGKLNRPYKTVMNGLEALEAFSAEPRNYCCILMDISMPVMDGLESTRHIRDLERRLSSTPITIFALTGLASAETQKEAFASGVDIFLTKPVRFNVLTERLAERGLI